MGYTLVELIIAIAILCILMAAVIFGTAAIIDNSKAAADRASLRILNDATTLYGTKKEIVNNDIFYGISIDSDRMNALMAKGYLQAAIMPQTEKKQFRWQIAAQEWTMDNIDTVITNHVVNMGTGGHSGYIKGAYTGSSTNIVIPKNIDGTIVTNIYQDVFNGKSLASVTFEADSMLRQIHARAFNNNMLTEIKLPETLQKIDYGAFSNNPITKITIGSGVSMESNAFQNNNRFKEAYLLGGAGTYLFISGKWEKQ